MCRMSAIVQRVRVHRDAERPRATAKTAGSLRPYGSPKPICADYRYRWRRPAGPPGCCGSGRRFAFVAVAAGGSLQFLVAPDAGRAVSRASRVPRPAPPAFQFPPDFRLLQLLAAEGFDFETSRRSGGCPESRKPRRTARQAGGAVESMTLRWQALPRRCSRMRKVGDGSLRLLRVGVRPSIRQRWRPGEARRLRWGALCGEFHASVTRRIHARLTSQRP